jgi:hypothetical protein
MPRRGRKCPVFIEVSEASGALKWRKMFRQSSVTPAARARARAARPWGRAVCSSAAANLGGAGPAGGAGSSTRGPKLEPRLGLPREEIEAPEGPCSITRATAPGCLLAGTSQAIGKHLRDPRSAPGRVARQLATDRRRAAPSRPVIERIDSPPAREPTRSPLARRTSDTGPSDPGRGEGGPRPSRAPRRAHDPDAAIRHSGASGDRPNQLLDGLASTTGQRSRPTMAPRNDPLGDVLRPNVPPTRAVSRSRPRETAFGRAAGCRFADSRGGAGDDGDAAGGVLGAHAGVFCRG